MNFSLCMTCMNRVKYLEEVMDINIDTIKEFNKNNKNQFELSLCNYDSKDNLDELMTTKYQDEINSGLIVYTKVEDKEHFHVSHAKNIAYKMSTGDVLFNLDCDNKLTSEVLSIYNKHFSENNIDDIYIKDEVCIGVAGISRTNFYKLGGYNEKMIGYGREDQDLHNRAEKYLECKIIFLPYELDYDSNVLHQNYFIKFVNHKKITPSGSEFTNIFNMIEYNISVEQFFNSRGIINPNEYNNIEFGKL